MRVAVVGVGCIGSVVAAALARAGHVVTLVARGERLRQLREHGLRVRVHGRSAVETHALPATSQLAEADAELVLVCVQTQQVDALLAGLESHPARLVAFMLNVHPVPSRWKDALGARLVLGFPAMLAGQRGDVVGYRTLPGWLRFVMISTLGPVRGGDEAGAREVVALLAAAGLASTYDDDMESWLATHSALVLGLMAHARLQLAEGEELAMSAERALIVARALAEAFALVRACGAKLTPPQLAALAHVPAPLVAGSMWSASRLPWFAQAVRDYAEHAEAEVRSLYTGLRAAAPGQPAPNLEALCGPIVARAKGTQHHVDERVGL